MGGRDSAWRTVVCVVGNVRHRGLDADPRPEMYLPHAQWALSGGAVRDMYIVLRTSRDPATLTGELRRTIQSMDPDLPVASIRPMTAVVSDATAPRRISFIVLVTIAVAAAGLAAVGLYGVISFAVAQRTTEIGIRRALGASAGTVVRVMMQQATGAVLAGLASGLILAAWLSRFMASMLFQIRPMDPITFLLVIALVSLVAVVASYIPARRATRIDPLTAVRSA